MAFLKPTGTSGGISRARQDGVSGDLASAKEEVSSLADEVSSLAEDFRVLGRLESELARTETKEQVRRISRTAGFGAAAAGLAFFAALFAALTLMFVLYTFLPLWLSALITAVAFAAGAFLLYSSARRELKEFSPVPRRFLRTIEEDFSWIGNLKASSSR